MDNTVISNLVLQMYNTFSKMINFFTFTLDDLVSKSGLNVDIPVIGDWSLIGLMFGGGFTIFLVVSVLNWVNPL